MRVLDSIGLVEEAVVHLKTAAVLEKESEIKLFCCVWKKAISSRRVAWRTIVKEEMKQRAIGNERFNYICSLQRRVIEEELLGLISEGLNHPMRTDEIRVKLVTLKFRADLFRYLVEVYKVQGSETVSSEAMQNARKCYQEASDVVTTHGLGMTDPIVLGLVLNHSVFAFEVLNKPREACILAKDALDMVMGSLGPLIVCEDQPSKSVSGEPIDPSLLKLIQLVRDNLVLWTSNSRIH